MATAVVDVSADYISSPHNFTKYLGETLVNDNGYSGILEFTAGDSSIPQINDTDTPSAGNISWMGTLEVAGVGSGTVALFISTSSTDVALLGLTAANGVSIYFAGSYDSISMSSYDMTVNGAKGESLDLSGTTIYTYEGSSSGWQVQPATIFGTSTGNDTFTGSAGTNVLYEGSGNSSFYQSAGNDGIDCSGGNSVYYAKDVATDYEGGWSDSSGNTYLNNGNTWVFTENGKTIELINVPTVSFDGVTYTDAVNNPTPTSSSTSSASTQFSVKTTETVATTSQTTTTAAASHVSTVDLSDLVGHASLHRSVLSDFSPLAGVQGAVSGAASTASTLTMTPALASYASLLTGSLHTAPAITAVEHHSGFPALIHSS